MATVAKTWAWLSTNDGWTFTNTSLNAFARSTTAGNPLGSVYGLESENGASSTGYGVASQSPTWEDLGVPAGATVTAVQVTNCDTYAGLTESNGFGSATWLTQIASSAASWAATTLCTRTRSSVDSAWYSNSGSEVAVPAGAQASNTVLQLTSRTTCVRSTGTGTGVSAHLDNLSLLITYTPAATPVTLTAASTLTGRVSAAPSCMSTPATLTSWRPSCRTAGA